MYGVTKDHKQRRTSYHLKSQFPTSKKTMDLLEVLQQEWEKFFCEILIVENDFY